MLDPGNIAQETESFLPLADALGFPSMSSAPAISVVEDLQAALSLFLLEAWRGYSTVTSVPIGTSAKNFRAASSGSRMQPCDAG